MEKIDIPISETFLASDGHTYKAVRSDCAETCRGCAFIRYGELCHRYSCMSDYRKDRTAVHFVECEEETKRGE